MWFLSRERKATKYLFYSAIISLPERKHKDPLNTCDRCAEALLANPTRCLTNEILHITEIRHASSVKQIHDHNIQEYLPGIQNNPYPMQEAVHIDCTFGGQTQNIRSCLYRKVWCRPVCYQLNELNGTQFIQSAIYGCLVVAE